MIGLNASSEETDATSRKIRSQSGHRPRSGVTKEWNDRQRPWVNEYSGSQPFKICNKKKKL